MRKPDNIITDWTKVPAHGSWGSYDEAEDKWSEDVYSGNAVREWIQYRLSIYGPYETKEEAIASIPSGQREIGLTVGIKDDENGIVEYQWKKGTDDEDLVKKTEDIVSTAEMTPPEQLSWAESPGTLTFRVDYNSRAAGRITIKRNGSQVDQQNILPGANTYTIVVPEEYQAYRYDIEIRDILGQIVNLDTSSFTVRVGTIQIQTNLQSRLQEAPLGEEIEASITVRNLGDPVHLYVSYDGSTREQIPGESFNSSIQRFQLNQVPGDHTITLTAYSYKDGQEVVDEYDTVECKYRRLRDGEYLLIIDNIPDVTTGQPAIVYFHYMSATSTQRQITFTLDGVDIVSKKYYSAFDPSCNYSLGYLSKGDHTIQLKLDGSVSETVTFNVAEQEIDDRVVEGALFLFDYNNPYTSGEYKLEYNGIADGVNGVDPDNHWIKFSGESSAKLTYQGRDFNPFSSTTENGYTIELLYNTKCIGNLTAPVMSTYENDNDNILGVQVSYNKIFASINGQRYSADVSENSWIHATVVFSTKNFSEDGFEINGRYLYIYINGCMVFVKDITNLPLATANAFLSLNVDNKGENFGESYIRTLRFYNKPLSPNEVVQNYIASIVDPDEKAAAEGRNKLDLPIITFTEYTAEESRFIRESLGINGVYTFADLLRQVDKSKQKVELVACNVKYKESEDSPVLEWEYATVGTQGTSTLQFPIKNFKIKLYKKNDTETTLVKNKVLFKESDGWAKEYTYTLKCDYMESSHLNNTPTCTYYNNTIDKLLKDEDFLDWGVETVSPARVGYNEQGDRRQYSGEGYGYLDAIKGFPCIVQYYDTSGVLHYLGTYMFNLDKEADSLGFDVYIKDGEENLKKGECVSIEGKSNTLEGAGSFCSFGYWLENKSGYNSSTGTYDPVNGYYALEFNGFYMSEKNEIDRGNKRDFAGFIAEYIGGKVYYLEIGGANKRTLISVDNPNSYFLQDFEARYVYDDDIETDPTGWHNWIEVINFISSSYDIASTAGVTQLQINEIKEEFEEYFSLNYCLLYYLLMIVFAQVDNAGKNCMWDCWDGKKWFPRPYDQDTMGGLDNSGVEKIEPYVEYNKKSSPGNYVDLGSLTGASITEDVNKETMDPLRYQQFNTSDSRMWVLFYILYKDEIKALYKNLRDKDIYDANTVLDFYFANTSDVIGETYYNRDSIAKYISPASSSGLYLDQLHGNRRERFKYWLTTRINFCDSLFEYNRQLEDAIALRISPRQSSTLVFKTYSPIYIHMIVGTIQGGDLSADITYNFYCSPESQYERGKEGVQITVPAFAVDKEVSIFGASSIKEIEGINQFNCGKIDLQYATKITSFDLYDNTNLTSLTFGNNTYLQNLSLRNITGINDSISLTGAENIKTVNLSGSSFNGLDLTTEESGTTVKNVDISNTKIEVLDINNAPFLQTLNVSGCNNMTTLMLINTAIEELAFSDLISLKKLNLVECYNLKSVSVTNIPNFELDGTTFLNCTSLEEIDLSGTQNKGTDHTLSIRSITNLKSLNIKGVYGIDDIDFDTENLETLETLDVSESGIKTLNLPSGSELKELVCTSCNDLTSVTGINADIDGRQAFFKCFKLISIKGSKLKASDAHEMFCGCYALNEIDVTTIDFNECSDYYGAFVRCYALPWEPIKRVLTSNANNVDLSYVLCYRYCAQDSTTLDKVPYDLFAGVPNAKTLRGALSYYRSIYQALPQYGYADPTYAFKRTTKVNFDASTPKLNNVASIYSMFQLCDITSVPDLSFVPNVEDVSGFVAGTKITSIPTSVFANTSKIKTANGAFWNCTSVNNNIGLMFDNLTDLEDASAMFTNCGIKGNLPEGLLYYNTKLKDVEIMFAQSKITGLAPLFKRDGLTATLNSLTAIGGMFGMCSSLTGDVPQDLFAGANDIQTAGHGSDTKTIIEQLRRSNWRGVFTSTKIEEVPAGLFNSFANATSVRGMFEDCLNALFPEDESGNPTLFLAPLVAATDLRLMFTNCKKLTRNVPEGFIPSRATTINGMFACSGVNNVIKLGYLTNLLNAVGVYACTAIKEYPEDVFEGSTELRNVSMFFYDCTSLDPTGGIKNTLLQDCTKLTSVSQMFNKCYSLGENQTGNTIPAGLLRNNANLTTMSYMFGWCFYLRGQIPEMFDNQKAYENLTDASYMFFRANLDPDENNGDRIFSATCFEPLQNLTTIEGMFAAVNNSNNINPRRAFKIPSGQIFYSRKIENATNAFDRSNLNGTVSSLLLRPSLSSLTNITLLFTGTNITEIENGFLLPGSASDAINGTLTNVTNAFRGANKFTLFIPMCNDNDKFKQIRSYNGYVYGTNAAVEGSFSGNWKSSATALKPDNYPGMAGIPAIEAYNVGAGYCK